MTSSAQIYLFTGENTYAVRMEKKKWITEFQKKHGEENCVILPPSIEYSALADEISASPFITEKRLVVVDGIPKGDSDDIARLPEVIHPSCILVFIEPSPDKRLGTSKAMLKMATVKEFTHLQGKAMQQWIIDLAKKNGKSIASDAIELLLTIVGDDEDQLSTEVDKLSLGTTGPAITTDDVVRLAVPGGEQEIWLLTALLVKGDPAPALSAVKNLLTRGEDPQSVWAILLWFLRQVASTAAGVASGERTPAGLGQKLQVPFPTAKTLLPAIQHVDMKALQQLLEQTVEADIGLKTGKHRSSSDAPQELLVLLDRLILGITALFAPTARSV